MPAIFPILNTPDYLTLNNIRILEAVNIFLPFHSSFELNLKKLQYLADKCFTPWLNQRSKQRRERMRTAICLSVQRCGCFLALYPLQMQYFRMSSRMFKCVISPIFIKGDKAVWYFLYCHQCRARSWGQGTMGNLQIYKFISYPCINLSVINTGHSCVHHSYDRVAAFHMLFTELGRTLSKQWKNKNKK